MGTWGHGNFENDTAAEYLVEFCQPLLEQIRKAVADPKSLEPDECDSDIMMANIEILVVMGENIGRTTEDIIGDSLFPFPYPVVEEIEQWKSAYLQVWDYYIDSLTPSPNYRKKRRELIVNTFDRLSKVARFGPPRNDDTV